MNTVSLFTSREPLPNKTEQQNQRKAKQTIHVEKYIESNPPWQKILYKTLHTQTKQQGHVTLSIELQFTALMLDFLAASTTLIKIC